MNSRTLLGPFGVTAVAIVVVVIACAAQLPPLFRATFKSSQSTDQAQLEVASLLASHQEKSELDQARFIGRSIFFIPPPPPPPPPPEEPRIVNEVPRISPAPATYGGPQAVAIFGQQVWFKEGSSSIFKLKADESQGSVRLVAIDPPWRATVAWKRDANTEEGEYVVRIFEKLAEGFAVASPPRRNRDRDEDDERTVRRPIVTEAETADGQYYDEGDDDGGDGGDDE